MTDRESFKLRYIREGNCIRNTEAHQGMVQHYLRVARPMETPMLLQVALWVLEHRRNAYIPMQAACGINRGKYVTFAQIHDIIGICEI